jgi:hypothetical protein
VLIEIILIYLFYLVILILGSYYVNLYISQDQFTKDDLKNIFPYLTQFMNGIMNNYSMSILAIVMIVSSFLGLILPILFQNWFFNSSILFIVMFFSFPLIKKNYDQAQVTTGGNLADTAMSLFMKYYNFVLIGFGTGTATALMHNWVVYKEIHFLWFLINLIAFSIFIGVAIRNTISK